MARRRAASSCNASQMPIFRVRFFAFFIFTFVLSLLELAAYDIFAIVEIIIPSDDVGNFV